MNVMQELKRALALFQEDKLDEAEAILDRIAADDGLDDLTDEEFLAYLNVAQPLGERRAFEEAM